MDIDPEVTARTRACLDAAGYGRVRVVLADAEHGVPDGAPYDRIIVTAGAWDIPPAWISQLAPGRPAGGPAAAARPDADGDVRAGRRTGWSAGTTSWPRSCRSRATARTPTAR